MKKIFFGFLAISAFSFPGLALAITDEVKSAEAVPEYDVEFIHVGAAPTRRPANEDIGSAINSDIQGGISTQHDTVGEEKSKIQSEIESMIKELNSTERNIDHLESQIAAASKRDDAYAVRRLRGEIIKRRIERKGFAEDIRALRQRLNQLGG